MRLSDSLSLATLKRCYALASQLSSWMGKQLLTGRRAQSFLWAVKNELTFLKAISVFDDGRLLEGHRHPPPWKASDGSLAQWLGRPSIEADTVTYASTLRQCENENGLSEGKFVHAHIICSGHDRNGFLGNLLIQMYGRCGALEDARVLFAQMHETDCFSWNLLMGAYVQNGQGKEAVQLFKRMQLEGFIPNKHTYLRTLAACAILTDPAKGKRMHAYIVSNGFESDIVLGTAIVNMYGKCHNVDDAKKMFESMLQRNVITWNAMISAYAQYGQGRRALHTFQEMLREGMTPSRVTFISVLDACASQATMAECKFMHSYTMRSGVELDVVVGTALVNMYGKCGNLEEARKMFDRMPDRNVVTWNAMIAVNSQYYQTADAFQLLEKMELAGVMPNKSTFVSILSACTSPEDLVEGKLTHSRTVRGGLEHDVVLGTALVSMYGKCGSLKDAHFVFDAMPTHDLISWTAIIAAYAQHGQGKEAIWLFQKMPPGVLLPDNVTFVSILDACANQGALAEGREMHARILDSEYESDRVVATALVNLYSKCGKLDDAQSVFDKIPQRDVISWNAIISAHAQHGEPKEALHLFHWMQSEGVTPDDVTFVCVLTACSHAGLVDEGNRYFCSLKSNHRISLTVEHYNCMLDLLGRAGCIEEGGKLINSMPFQPSATSWITLLGACRMHFDVEHGEQAARHVFEMEPEYGAPYVLLSNIYVAVGRLDAAENLRDMMKGKILKKQTGYSSIEVGGRVHDFFLDQDEHPQIEMIYA